MTEPNLDEQIELMKAEFYASDLSPKSFDLTIGIRTKMLVATQIQEARNKTINEVIEAIEPNQQGQWQDDGGNVAWYLDELLDRIAQLRSTK